MKTRRVAAVLIAGGITLMSAPAFATGGPEHKITICHSGNGKHFTSIKVDYAGARGHAKTDEHDIIPPFEDFPGQGDQSILENQCKEATTTTTRSTPTTTASTTTSTSLVTTSSLPTTTTLTTLPTTTITVTTVTPITQTTLRPASTTTTTAPKSEPTVTTPSSVQPTTTVTLPTSVTEPTTPATALAPEVLPVTGSEPTGLVYGGLVLLALGLLLVGLSKWS